MKYLFVWKNYCIQSKIYSLPVNINFFEIRKYSGRNFNLVQKIHFFHVITGIFESKTLPIITMLVFFETTFNNFILKAMKYLFVWKNYCIQTKIYSDPVNMNFFEIRKYSVRNFKLVKKNYISLSLIPVSLS